MQPVAFVRYNPVKGLAGSPWVGLTHFREVFRRGVMAGLLRNALLISSGKILLGEVAGLAFALLVREVGWRPYRRLVQTVATIPHFFSWVIMGALMLSILGSSGGVNDLLVSLGLAKVRFLADKRIFPYMLVLSDVWKEFGWSSVIYLAALTQIDPHLIEAAAFVRHWNAWFDGVVYLRNASNWPLQSYLYTVLTGSQLTSEYAGFRYSGRWPNVSADGVGAAMILFAVLPVLVIYPILQRYFVSGISLGAVKG